MGIQHRSMCIMPRGAVFFTYSAHHEWTNGGVCNNGYSDVHVSTKRPRRVHFSSVAKRRQSIAGVVRLSEEAAASRRSQLYGWVPTHSKFYGCVPIRSHQIRKQLGASHIILQ